MTVSSSRASGTAGFSGLKAWANRSGGEIAVIVIFLLIWFINFGPTYGWLMDDRGVYIKGVDVVNNIMAIFSYWNVLHAYFLVDSYLPIVSKICVPSYQLPIFGPSTCNFRFAIAFTIVLHAIVLLALAVLFRAAGLTTKQRILALILTAVSPALTFWTPQLDSRILGIPFIVAGILLMQAWANDREGGGLWKFLTGVAAGILFWTSQSIHYTSLYLLIPFLIAFFLTNPLGNWKSQVFWLFLIGLGIGFIVPMIVLELSYLHIPGMKSANSPFLSMLQVGSIHQSGLTSTDRLRFWAKAANGLYGVPFLLLCVAYAFDVGSRVRRRAQPSSSLEVRLLLAAVIAICLVVSSPEQPFARQLSVVVPLLCLSAACGVTAILALVRHHRRTQWAIGTALIVATLATPVYRSFETLKAHRGLGRALSFVQRHTGSPVAWLETAWFPDDPRSPPSVFLRAELDALAPDTLVISYQPWMFLRNSPSFRAMIRPENAEYVRPNLYSTFAMWTELFGRGHPDFRYDPAMANVMVFRAGKIQSPRDEAPLRLAQISGSSANATTAGPEKVFDRDSGGRDYSGWVSAKQLPATLHLRFAVPSRLEQMLILARAADVASVYVDAVEITGRRANGEISMLWSGAGLAPNTVIHPTWPAQDLVELEIKILSTKDNLGHRRDWSEIEEIVFPGYRVVLPAGDPAPPAQKP